MGSQPGTRRAVDDDVVAFSALHWLAAALFAGAGTGAAIAWRRRGTRARSAHLVPLLAAPVAGTIHAAHALRPDARTRSGARILDGIAVGIGAARTLTSLLAELDDAAGAAPWSGRSRARAGWRPDLVPLVLGATGALGFILGGVERAEQRERERLERRARIVERLVPRRRPRIDHIVVHV